MRGGCVFLLPATLSLEPVAVPSCLTPMVQQVPGGFEAIGEWCVLVEAA
jgi:hypothetical protein